MLHRSNFLPHLFYFCEQHETCLTVSCQILSSPTIIKINFTYQFLAFTEKNNQTIFLSIKRLFSFCSWMIKSVDSFVPSYLCWIINNFMYKWGQIITEGIFLTKYFTVIYGNGEFTGHTTFFGLFLIQVTGCCYLSNQLESTRSFQRWRISNNQLRNQWVKYKLSMLSAFTRFTCVCNHQLVKKRFQLKN